MARWCRAPGDPSCLHGIRDSTAQNIDTPAPQWPCSRGRMGRLAALAEHSAAGERAVGQRPDCRCQQPGVFERQVICVEVDQGVADDDRAAVSGAEQVGEVGVLSAAGLGGGGLGRDAGFVHRRRPWRRAGRRVIKVAGQADRHHRVRIRDRPEHQHLRTSVAQLPHQAGQAVDPRRVV